MFFKSSMAVILMDFGTQSWLHVIPFAVSESKFEKSWITYSQHNFFSSNTFLPQTNHIQWRIQDFPEEGAPTHRWGAPEYDFIQISRKLHEIIGNSIPGGRPLPPPLDPPLISTPKSTSSNNIFLKLCATRPHLLREIAAQVLPSSGTTFSCDTVYKTTSCLK